MRLMTARIIFELSFFPRHTHQHWNRLHADANDATSMPRYSRKCCFFSTALINSGRLARSVWLAYFQHSWHAFGADEMHRVQTYCKCRHPQARAAFLSPLAAPPFSLAHTYDRNDVSAAGVRDGAPGVVGWKLLPPLARAQAQPRCLSHLSTFL